MTIDIPAETPCDVALELFSLNRTLDQLELSRNGHSVGHVLRYRVFEFFCTAPEDVFDRTPLSWLAGRTA